MLTGLRLGNFKAFAEEQHFPIRPITLIFGANSSGKSSIIHSLLLANHALETNDWDVHQPRLGAESVDLGGFPHFVHRHQREGQVTLHFEKQLGGIKLRDFLDGEDAEISPFLQLGNYGVSLKVGRSEGAEASGSSDGPLAVQSVGICFQRQPALEFARVGPAAFRCVGVECNHPFIRQLLKEMLVVARARPSEHHLADSHDLIAAMREEMGAPPPPDSPEKAKRRAEIDLRRDALRERFSRLAEARFLEEETRSLGETLAQVLTERSFGFQRHCLADDGPDNRWDWAGWRDQLAEGQYHGVLGFFREQANDVGEEAGDDIYGQRWAEAQAIRFNLTHLVELLTELTREILLKLSYLGPQRVVPPRHLLAMALDTSRSSGSGLEAWKHVCRDESAQEAVNRWFGAEWLQMPCRLKVRQLVDAEEPTVDIDTTELLFEDSNTGTRLSHCDLGFGVTQALPVLVNAAAFSNRIIAVEQPELHLHPAQQAELGDVFIESALGERKNTFLLETHSEHLILRIMRRIRQTHSGKIEKGLPPIKASDVSVLYVERLGTRSILREFPLNERGELVKAWPKGFFEEGLREVLG